MKIDGRIPKLFVARAKTHTPRRGNVTGRAKILTKRRKFVVVSLVLSAMLFLVQTVPVEYRNYVIVGLGVMSYSLSAAALFRDLRGVEWITVLALPTLYPVSVALFYFLLPQEMIVRVVVNIIFAISMYALLLTANIFAVATIRTIQLLRAARTVGFLLTILSSAFIYHVIFALKLHFLFSVLLVAISSFLLMYQGIWSYTLNLRRDPKEITYALVGASILTQITLMLTFWQVDIALASILLAMVMYVVLGLFQHDLEKRLFTRTTQEYVGFAAIVFVVITTATIIKWMG